MHDSHGVRGVQAIRCLTHDVHRTQWRQRAVRLHDLGERRALDVLHGEVEEPIGRLTEIVDGRDVRVIDAAGVGCLSIESTDRLGVAGHRRMEHLDRALPAHLHVLGEVDASHPARAQQLQHVITLGNDGADEVRAHAILPVQRRPILRAEPLGLWILSATDRTDLRCAHSVCALRTEGGGDLKTRAGPRSHSL